MKADREFQISYARWRVFYIKASPARELDPGLCTDDVELARAEAISRLGPERQSKIMVVKAV
jgi:hypothetical protein